ncbi:UNVERIFIED_CONTAM: hypothetical protein GTU68_025495 [Idotea baltica]|nr:hypothetical protein [Idotea baltica]
MGMEDGLSTFATATTNRCATGLRSTPPTIKLNYSPFSKPSNTSRLTPSQRPLLSSTPTPLTESTLLPIGGRTGERTDGRPRTERT